MLRGALLLLRFTSLSRLVTRLMLDRRVPLRLKLILPAAIAYLVSPLDIVPDILPALGRIDDLLVLVISIVMFLGMVPENVLSEHLRSAREGKRSQDTTARPEGQVIEGSYRFVDDGEEAKR